ncbi:glycosyltransferase family 39 protein [Actinoplanes palleronii]|uniref:Membrane protein n=1 Tax=Actinoplanes palleronii TaxID=113570 RepID=A0ABQ4BF11_9ACTN|nr:glycosyltransferase family 39 protein [Actinoplanes palleronii]GIE69278.1 membrane protein [Actinoplanes palleronii]
MAVADLTWIPAQRSPEHDVPARAAPAGDFPAPRRRVGLRVAWPAIAGYAALRAIGLLALAFFGTGPHRDLWAILGRYDAGWYAGIATRGYDLAIPLHPDGSLATTNLAFFPLYPGLIALLDPVLPGDAAAAGITLAWLAGLVAAWGLFAIGTHLHSRRAGVLLAALWAVVPHAMVESMGYTETLFTALCAWSLFAVLRRHWLTAGLLCALAGLTRPTGAALIAAVGLAALAAGLTRRDGWRPWAAGLIAPIGLFGYVVWVGHRLGRADGYFHVQKDAWKMSYDDGGYTLGTARTLLTGRVDLAYLMCALVLLAAIVLAVVLSANRRAWPLAVFSLVIVAMVFFGDGYFHAKGRLLIPAFPLLLPIATGLAGAHRRTMISVLTVLAVISAIYGVYLARFWTHSP